MLKKKFLPKSKTPRDEGRPLTSGETKLAQMLFGDAIDYAKVRIHDKTFSASHPENRFIVNYNHIFTHNTYKADYSRTGPDARIVFIKQMARVWQYQNNLVDKVVLLQRLTLRKNFTNSVKPQSYLLERGKGLMAYNADQQISILRDFYSLKYEEGHRVSDHCLNEAGNVQKRVLYEGVLENFLKNPLYSSKRIPVSQPKP